MTDFGMMMITEDGLDDYFEAPEPSNTLTEGRNIKTGCYGLFLCALDGCQDNIEQQTLQEACEVIENIKGCVAFCSLSMYYPPPTLDYDSILRLAEAVIHLNDALGGIHAEDVSGELIEAVERIFRLRLTMRDGFEPIHPTEEGAPRQLELFDDLPPQEITFDPDTTTLDAVIADIFGPDVDIQRID